MLSFILHQTNHRQSHHLHQNAETLLLYIDRQGPHYAIKHLKKLYMIIQATLLFYFNLDTESLIVYCSNLSTVSK